MSPEPSPAVATAAEAARGSLASPDAGWRSLDCAGCGQRPDDLSALDAIALTVMLRRRCASLLAEPDATLRRHGPKPGAWSALEPVGSVSAVIATANQHLRCLLGDQAPTDIRAATEGAPSTAVALAENFRRLIATIGGATAHDWYRPRPDNGATAGEAVWLALHEATHHVEDAELVLDAASATSLTLR